MERNGCDKRRRRKKKKKRRNTGTQKWQIPENMLVYKSICWTTAATDRLRVLG